MLKQWIKGQKLDAGPQSPAISSRACPTWMGSPSSSTWARIWRCCAGRAARSTRSATPAICRPNRRQSLPPIPRTARYVEPAQPSPTTNMLYINNLIPPFDNKLVREAVAYAINKKRPGQALSRPGCAQYSDLSAGRRPARGRLPGLSLRSREGRRAAQAGRLHGNAGGGAGGSGLLERPAGGAQRGAGPAGRRLHGQGERGVSDQRGRQPDLHQQGLHDHLRLLVDGLPRCLRLRGAHLYQGRLSMAA